MELKAQKIRVSCRPQAVERTHVSEVGQKREEERSRCFPYQRSEAIQDTDEKSILILSIISNIRE